MPLQDLAGSSERRLAESLSEIAQLPSLAALDLEEDRTGELVGRFPGWARSIAALARSEQTAIARAQILSDRISNDPFLGATIHSMLSRITAIRSAAEILTEYDNIPADRRERFSRIIYEESSTLSEVGEALAAYLDKAEDTDRVLTPVDEVDALFEARRNRFEEIEAAASGLGAEMTRPDTRSRRAIADALARERLEGTIRETIAAQPQIVTGTARSRAHRALTAYAVSAILMPMEEFAPRAAALGYDVEALAQAFSTEIEAVCHRLTALAGPKVPRFGYFQANAAGTIIEMIGLEGLAVPRYAAVCPLWALFRAQQSPEAVIRQRALFPSGARFVFLARARHTAPLGFGRPRQYVTDMLVMTETDAALTVYAPDSSTYVEEVGPSCRLCPRRGCPHRVEDPLSP